MDATMSMLWFSVRDFVTLLLVIWTAAIAVFVHSDLVSQFIWIPVSLGLAGVLGSIFMLALPANVIVAANVATLLLFVVSFEVLKGKLHSRLISVKHRG
jgi:hypothetical protein